MERIKNIKLFLFDMDGTLYLGDRLYDFTKELLATIKATGGRYMFMTNNSSKSVKAYIQKLAKLGIESTEEDFITSSQATAWYLKREHPGKTLYVCGTQSLKEELASHGFPITEDIDKTECIVLGFDTELTFKKLEDISKMLCTRELPYIATNPDLVCPTEFGSVPDCGSVTIGLYNATGKKPLVIGKPEPLMPTLAMEKYSIAPENTAVIGDRIYTDIKSGLAAGALSILVMSGETTVEILEASEEKPHLVLDSAAEILKLLKA